VALQQQQVAEEIVATAQLLLQQLILFGEQGARKDLIAARDIIPREQMRQRGNLFAPGQFFQQAVQIDDAAAERGFGQGRQVRTQFGQPAQNMRIPPHLLQAADLRVASS
jgi:hypothetical protein